MSNVLTEKYRPKTLDEVIGQDHIVPRLKKCVENQSLSHMLFVGKPGIGKTSLAHALARDFFGKDWKHNFYELNASDDRSLKIVREKIKEKAQLMTYNNKMRIIFLDEADSLHHLAQPALRRIIEDYSEDCRFILSCNYGNKIIEPIVDRLIELRFKSLNEEDITKVLKKIASAEELNITDDAYTSLAKASNGSMRKVVSLLGMFKDEGITTIDNDAVISRFNWVDIDYIKKLIGYAIKGNMEETDKMIDDMIGNKLYSPNEILEILRKVIQEAKSIPKRKKLKLLMKIGETNFRISNGCSPQIQLKAFVALMIYEFDKK